MPTSRLEAFSDGVLAIIITIMVLELKIPTGASFEALRHAAGTGLLSYLLSFVYVGIYWNNHHHMFHLAQRVSGGVLWGNLGLLFCLSLVPFTTAWMDNTDYARIPVLVYGVNLLLAGIAGLRFLEIRGVAETATGPHDETGHLAPEIIRLHPHRVLSFNVDGPGLRVRDAGRPPVTSERWPA